MDPTCHRYRCTAISWLQVVKYCKILPSMMTNLPRPKSYLVERFVMDVLHMLHGTKQAEALTCCCVQP